MTAAVGQKLADFEVQARRGDEEQQRIAEERYRAMLMNWVGSLVRSTPSPKRSMASMSCQRGEPLAAAVPS